MNGRLALSARAKEHSNTCCARNESRLSSLQVRSQPRALECRSAPRSDSRTTTNPRLASAAVRPSPSAVNETPLCAQSLRCNGNLRELSWTCRYGEATLPRLAAMYGR